MQSIRTIVVTAASAATLFASSAAAMPAHDVGHHGPSEAKVAAFDSSTDRQLQIRRGPLAV